MSRSTRDYKKYKFKIDIPITELKHFVYRHIRIDTNEVFYIGCGNMNQGYPSRAIKKTSRNKTWFEITNETEWYSELIYQTNDLDEMYEKEKEFIKLYKPMDDGGTLCNRSYGGFKGSKLTEVKKREMSIDLKEHHKNNEHPLKGRPKSEEHKQILSEKSVNKKTIYCESNGKEYESIKKCIEDIFGVFKKSYENGIRNNTKINKPYKNYKFNYKIN